MSKATTKSGIEELKNGERHIPSSVRADGTVRKEIRVRPGYRPPEDVEVYKNKTAEAWKNKGKGGVPGASFVEGPSKEAKDADKKKTTAKSKAKGGPNANAPQSSNEGAKPQSTENVPSIPVDPEVEKEKEARKLSKKLRQARELQGKKEKGDALLPEQFEKVIKINELMRQLEALGFDTEGQKKT